ncbi:hypothetical protein HPB52_013280 [Rhipicephalus sanguineus]|uniref:Uncharacterized protein n=2 Tax=Rhipicephalus sanguineus TaxID=34632 RepID=A0A9D4T3Q8_RHISA|nr:hypothetical protein HPB52_013280 [Rhipicephalus sanguineus]
MGRATDSQESLRSANKESSRGVGSEHGFRHLFDSCAHCDWIWKGDACDIFYRELGNYCTTCRELHSRASVATESITYELASRPDPGLFARFFADKGYQKGRAVQDSDKTAAASSSSPTRGTWASDADWRAQISNLATHEKRTRRSAKMLLAQQALNRLRHWTSGHHHHHHAMTTDNGGSPLRQDLMDDAKSAEEAKTLLRRPREEDCSEAYSEDMSTLSSGGAGCAGGAAKASSSAGDLLLGLGPTHFKGISRRVQSSTAVAVKTQDAGHARASGDFCCPAASGGVFLPEGRALSAASSEETWSTTGKKGGHHFASSQRSIDGFFKRLVRKK